MVFSGRLLRVGCSPNYLGYNRVGVLIGLKSIKSTKRHFWKRRILALAAKLPNVGCDILFILFSLPTFRKELESEFGKIVEVIARGVEETKPKPVGL